MLQAVVDLETDSAGAVVRIGAWQGPDEVNCVIPVRSGNFSVVRSVAPEDGECGERDNVLETKDEIVRNSASRGRE